jgi:hypothetical protein
MPKKVAIEVGDVVVSPAFAYGYSNGNKTFITVDGRTKRSMVTYYPSGTSADLGAYDPSRGEAKFVVVRAEMEGGQEGGGMNGHDSYPDGLHIMARRLTARGKYDEHGELIVFYMSGCFNGMIPKTKVKVVGRMKQIFVPV